jgi:putative glycerol kinase 5
VPHFHFLNSVLSNGSTLLTDADAEVSDVKVFGLSTQRGSFVTWDKRTGKPFHNFITWKDLRADHLVKSWNNSWTLHVRFTIEPHIFFVIF